jgi:hypothetical protein
MALSRKEWNVLLIFAGVAFWLLKGRSMPGAGTIAGIPVSEIEGGPTGLNNETLHNTGMDPGYVWDPPWMYR